MCTAKKTVNYHQQSSDRMNDQYKSWNIVPILILVQISLSAQDYTWWNETHNWDGVTHWTRYVIESPGFMGPNALPVPEVKEGSVPSSLEIDIDLVRQQIPGDRTHNLFTSLFIPIDTASVGINLSMVPLEYYRFNAKVRDERRARDFDGRGSAIGDLYVGTQIQIVKNRPDLPNLMLSINLRTASGSKLSAARHTDSPGYYFDLSMGKRIALKNSIIKSIRPFGMLGFYAWQTRREDYFQNDALLYGLGLDLSFSKIQLIQTIRGYRGYIGNGDRPLVIRFLLRTRFSSMVNYTFSMQKGLVDFLYSTFSFGIKMNLKGD